MKRHLYMVRISSMHVCIKACIASLLSLFNDDLFGLLSIRGSKGL